MKDIYYNNFLKYAGFVKDKDFNSYSDVMHGVSELMVPKVDSDDDKKALVMFGFSGNGKTTWINNFCRENPDYTVLSMDSVVRELSDKLGRRVDGMEITKAFSDKLDEVCSIDSKVIIDGNFLNLLTRMALVDSLHTYGFGVSVVDITPIFDITIQKRILAEASRVIGEDITEDNVDQFRDDFRFKHMEKRVMDYHNMEKLKSSYVEQTMLGATSFGVEDVIVVDSGSKSDNIGGKKI